jgi:hypothetical protein
MKRLFVIAFLSCSLAAAYPQIILDKPMSVRQTGYNIDVTLDTSSHVLHGRMKAFWVNLSKGRVDNVQMHLYLNAFRNYKSSFNSGANRPLADSGYVDITGIALSDGTDLSRNMQFISPDDGNPHDKTVIKIDLPRACSPGDTVKLDIEFISKLPGTIIRTGYSRDFYFVAQWFPKFGVYETAGMRYAVKDQWNCRQFHPHSEFYANHSVYDVTITVPITYVVGSGGKLLDEQDNGNQTKTVTLRAEDIVDFAWTAWPGYISFSSEWQHVRITLLTSPERKYLAERQLEAARNALEYLDRHCGRYPWPYITVVDPPLIGSGAGGMEYTTLITSTSFSMIPEYLRFPELVTVHELAHSYFMGMMASNEAEEPWLDEGVTTYWEGRMMDHYYNGVLTHPLLKLSGTGTARMSYVRSDSRQAADNSLFAWQFPHKTYSMLSYSKAGTILHTLHGILGEEIMDEIFREYYRKWAFKHPSGKDFINTANEVVAGKSGMYGPDLNWFFDQTIYGTEICDYRVAGFRSTLMAGADSVFRSVVELERIGGLMLPVEVLVHFDNGEEVLESWDGKSRTKDFSYTGARKVEWVKIDPEYKILMDVNQVNNSKTLSPDNQPIKRISSVLFVFLQLLFNSLTI